MAVIRSEAKDLLVRERIVSRRNLRKGSKQPQRYSNNVNILLTGNPGKFLQKIAAAFPPRSGISATTIPLSPQLLEAVQSPNLGALVLALTGSAQADSVQWIRQKNPALLIVAVLPRQNAKLRKSLLEEGVAAILSAQGLTPTQIRRQLLSALRGKPSASDHLQQLRDDLHTIRSTLTAIQGGAELSLQDSPRSAPLRKQMPDVIRGVAEIESLLRRIERNLRAAGMPLD
ncbi:MAG: hypothetical protein HY648_04255 [Acidobacteria bacterium]|nr:hypothetical protein [Acidobacteriota bacterium]